MPTKARALYDCVADDVEELSFKEGDILVDVVESDSEGWLEAVSERTRERGLVPKNYVELFEDKPKPPKVLPRGTAKSVGSNGVKSTGPPAIMPKPTVNADRPLGGPRKLSANVIAGFEKTTNTTTTPTDKSSVKSTAPLTKPKPDISGNGFKTNTHDVEEEEESATPVSVSALRRQLESKVQSSPPPVAPKPRTSIMKTTESRDPQPSAFRSADNLSDDEPDSPFKRPSEIKKLQKEQSSATLVSRAPPALLPKPSLRSAPPPVAPRNVKPSVKEVRDTPLRKLSDAPPPTPPRPKVGSQARSEVAGKLENVEGAAKKNVQDEVGNAASRQVGKAFGEGRGQLSNSKYSKYTRPYQGKVLDKAETVAKDQAQVRSRSLASDAFDDTLSSVKSTQPKTSRPEIPSRKNTFNRTSIMDKVSARSVPTRDQDNTPPPLPDRKNTTRAEGESTSKIPPRPPQHNPFNESNLSKGIPRNARERYEIVFAANMDEDGYIDTNETLLDIGDVVKEIYMRSRLDKKTLSKIWSLCDSDEDGRLSQHEFCVGMFLIDGRLQGNRVPDTLPDELIE
ncbi:2467_t:CDS:2 [Paraglomus brasilianum]|uniref:2467_t:CDS:1 n=1 Tax=Paraglomus brasilianum TaxID=144538 RepID=A0A9N9FB07_9GLOM|nr:2467_t:CDS:2 [Paraglomus brasilianum]